MLSRAETETAVCHQFATIQDGSGGMFFAEMRILSLKPLKSHFCRNFRRDCHLERSKIKIEQQAEEQLWA